MKPTILIVLDGWGVGPKTPANPLCQANLPTLMSAVADYPSTLLQASGISVGLLWGESGNSEAGHLTLGAGKTIYQYLPRIILSIREGSFFKNPSLLRAMQNAKKNNSRLHIMGLVGSGAVHSYIDHLYALLELAKQQGLDPEQVIVHVFTDGRDGPPTEGRKIVQTLKTRLEKERLGRIGSIIGRFYPMDRDENWDRTKAAYDLLTKGTGEKIKDPVAYLDASYKKGDYDEFVKPAWVDYGTDDTTQPMLVREDDSLIYFNYREDSARQLTQAFSQDWFDAFERSEIPDPHLTTLTEYEKDFSVEAAYHPPKITEPLGKILDDANFNQFRIAETEKYAHVTYFFNGLHNKPFRGEKRILVKSLATAHFDEHPEMAAEKLTQRLLKAIASRAYQFFLANFANFDMMGHTGNFDSAIKASETIDRSLKKIIDVVLKEDLYLVITSDHGNGEHMIDLMSGEARTEHTTNPVPFILIGNEFQKKGKSHISLFLEGEKEEITGILTDVAPTILELLEIKQPKEMTGKSLLSSLL